MFITFRDYRVEWEKIRAEAEAKKTEELKANKMEQKNPSNLLTEVPVGRELSDVYLRHPANESSSDSEGEEAPFEGSSRYFKLNNILISIYFRYGRG